MKVSICIVAMQQQLMEQVYGVFLMTFLITFGIDNSSSGHTHNYKNNFIVLVKGPSDDSNVSVSAAEQKLSINFSKAKIKL